MIKIIGYLKELPVVLPKHTLRLKMLRSKLQSLDDKSNKNKTRHFFVDRNDELEQKYA